MTWKLALLGLVFGLLAVLGSREWGRREPQFELTILHTNDVHSHYFPGGADSSGGAARLATRIREVRAEVPDALLLDAGDQFQGTLAFHVGGAEVVADVMNALGYDAMVPGNHEFDRGPDELARFARRAAFPILSANIDVEASTALADELAPYEVFLIGSEAVAVVGLTTEATSISSRPGPDVRFASVADRAAAAVDHLEAQGIRVIVALTHIGYAEDVALAAGVAGIDVIVGGHSHTWLGAEDDMPYPTLVDSPSGDPVVIVTAGEWGAALGRLDVRLRNGIVTDARGELLSTSATVAPDPSVALLLAPYEDRIDGLLAASIGSSLVDLDGERSHVRSRETNLGNVVADAMRWKASPFGAEIALQNGGGIRASIPQGSITMGDVLAVLPFGNEIVVLTLPGDALLDALENGVSQIEALGGRFPQVSGLRLEVNPSGDPGSRIESIDVWDAARGAYVPMDPRRAYIVATNDFLADGGDGFAAFASAAARVDTGWLVSDALTEYVEENTPLRPEIEGRIRMGDD